MPIEDRPPAIGSLTENWAPWPRPYPAETDSCIARKPRLSRHTILELAPTLVRWFLDDDQRFGLWYRQLVDIFRDRNLAPQDLHRNYLCLIDERFGRDDPRRSYAKVANEHDLANLHRATWLLMYHGICRLLNYNLHGDWGDPPGGATSQGLYDDKGRSRHAKVPALQGYFVTFHTNPNYYGSYAIGSADIPPPDLGVGDAPSPSPSGSDGVAAGSAVEDDSRSQYIDVRKIGKALGRCIVDQRALDVFGQHPYHRVVKRYYFDHLDHTEEYAKAIGDLLYPNDPESSALTACRIGADEVAEIHRCAWLFLTHRFSFLVGRNPFGDDANVSGPQHAVPLNTELGLRTFEVPNARGVFTLNLDDVDPELTPVPPNSCIPTPHGSP